MMNTNNITKELRKITIGLIKDTVKDRKFRKEIIGQVRKMGYDQPEKKLAYLLLDNNMMRVYVRAFCTLQRPNYFFQWLNDDYDSVVKQADMTTKMICSMHRNHNAEVAIMDGQVLNDMVDTITNGHIDVLEQKKAIHDKLIEQYKMEFDLYLLDLKASQARLEGRIKDEKAKLEKFLQ